MGVGQAAPRGLDDGGGGPGLRWDPGVAGGGESSSGGVLVAQERLAGGAVDAAGESGDEGFAVLGDDEGVAFGELSDLGSGEDGDGVASLVPLQAEPGAVVTQVVTCAGIALFISVYVKLFLRSE